LAARFLANTSPPRTKAATEEGVDDPAVQEMPQNGKGLQGGGSLPGNMQNNRGQVVPTSALEGCSEEEWEKSGNEGCI